MGTGDRTDKKFITSVTTCLEQFSEEIEIDLQRYYNIDVRDYWRDPDNLTPRRMAVLLSGLPPESQYQTVLRDEAEEQGIETIESDNHGSWSRQDYLLATLVDSVNFLAWVTSNQGTKPGQQSPRPKPIPRPGVDTKKKKIDMDVMIEMQQRREQRQAIIDDNNK